MAGITTTKDAINYNCEFCSGGNIYKKLYTCEINIDDACNVGYNEELVIFYAGICQDDSGVFCLNSLAQKQLQLSISIR